MQIDGGVESAHSVREQNSSFLLIRDLAVETAIAGAILYYFGYVRTRSALLYYGIDPSMLDLSFQDYIVRSINSVASPILATGLLSMLCIAIWLVAAPKLGKARAYLVGHTLHLVVSSALFIVGLAGVILTQSGVGHPPPYWTLALVCVGMLGIGVALSRFSRLPQVSDYSRSKLFRNLGITAYAMSVIFAFGFVGSFAEAVGEAEAKANAKRLSQLPLVVIYSEQRLGININGVRLSTINEPDSRYRFRYDSLHLFAHAADRYFLVADTWLPGDSIVMLRDDGSFRIDVRASA